MSFGSTVIVLASFLTGAFVAAAGSASAVTNPNHVSFTLYGCRAATDAYLPGTFICPDGAYTSGNLGAGWNELDLVPHRLVTSSGNQGDVTQDYTVAVAADNYLNNDGIPGYDDMSAAAKNAGLSDASCSVSAGAIQTTTSFGGTYQTLYRLLTIHQAPGTTCTFDWWEELAFGSHNNSGSSLHSNIALVSGSSITTQGIGAKDVSIPVKPILPPTVTKTMSASQDSTVQWQVHKSASPTSLTFGDSCDQTAGALSKTTDVTVSWTKQSVTPSGNIDTFTTVSVTNPAHRVLNLNVTDEIFGGATAGTAGTGVAGPSYSGSIAGGTLTPLAVIDNVEQSVTAASLGALGSPASVSDRATAHLIDPLNPSRVYTLTDTASAAIQSGSQANSAIDVVDVERLVKPADDPDNPSLGAPSNVHFSAAVLSGTGGYASGGFSGGYAGAATSGPVTWSVSNQSTSGSVTFRKTVTVDAAATVSATLYDRATIYPTGTTTSLGSDTASVSISASPLVSLTISKTIPLVLGANDTPYPTFTFNVTGPSSYSSSPTISFGLGDGGSLNPKTATLSALQPGAYSVQEVTLSPYAPQSAIPVTITPDPAVGFSTCSSTATVTNSFGPASARVQKVTVPAGSEAGWEFTLTGPGTPAGGEKVTTTGTSFVNFTTSLQEGAYTVTETAQSNWDNTGVSEQRNSGTVNDQTSAHQCTFTVNYTADADAVFSCVFTNTKRGHVTVMKTENGAAPTHAYSFRLTGGPDSISSTLTTDGTNLGNLDFGYQKPGSYTLCELAVPVGTHSTLQDAPYNGTFDAGTGNVCVTFNLAANQSKVFTIDNTYPLGNTRTIGYWKNWNTCAKATWDKATKTGNHLMDEFLPPYGAGVVLATGAYPFTVTTCTQGVSVLSTASAKYAEHALGAQLLAARLNVAAGAAHSATTDTKIGQAVALLGTINWVGSPTSMIVGNSYPTRATFLSLASYLDGYNNGKYS